MAITSTIWPLQPHTEAKHIILKKYLDAWLPILTKYQGRVIFIDGFAGPGGYTGGEDGSPIIALKAVMNHKIPIKAEVVFLFIEKDKERYEFLKNKIKKMSLKENMKYKCINDEFANVIGSILDDIEKNNHNLAPTFVFIDPFGFSGIPMQIIKRLMKNKKCEVLISFMYEDISRFIGLSQNEENGKKLFENEEWKLIIQRDSKEKEKLLHQLYQNQLRNFAEIKYVKSFKMKNKFNKSDYYLFFGTNNELGLEKMKEAMWQADASGKFEFSDVTSEPTQTLLSPKQPNYSLLKTLIMKKFKGQKVKTEDLRKFVVLDTPFLRTHYKSEILRPMEEKEEIKVLDSRKKRFSYPDGVTIEFLKR